MLDAANQGTFVFYRKPAISGDTNIYAGLVVQQDTATSIAGLLLFKFDGTTELVANAPSITDPGDMHGWLPNLADFS